MRVTYRFLGQLLVVTVLQACSNTKFLPDDEILYTGIKKVVIVPQGDLQDIKGLESSVYWSAYFKPNNSFYLPKRVLPPVRLWIYNYMDSEKEKGFKHWIHKNFSQPPVLIRDVNLDARVKKLESELFNEGYFDAKVNYLLYYKPKNPKKASVIYQVLTPEPYTYQSINFMRSQTNFDTIIQSSAGKSLIRAGDNYDLETVLQERDRITNAVRDSGFYNFRKEYLMFNLDTSQGLRVIDAHVTIAENLPKISYHRQYINKINVKMIAGGIDTTLSESFDTLRYGDMTIAYDNLFFKPQMIQKAMYQKPGEHYRQTYHSKTQTHLSNFEVFKQINIRYDSVKSHTDLLDMNITLTPIKKISLSAEANMVTKSSGFAGPAVVAGLQNQNVFKGGEKLNISLKAGFEWQTNTRENTGLGFNSYELGANASLSFPRVIAPFALKSKTNVYIPQTSVNAGFEFLNRVQYYRMNSFNVSYGYSWKTGRYNQHNFAPANFNFVVLVDTTPEFSEIYKDNPSVRRSFEEQNILSIRYRYAFDNSLNKEKKHRISWESGTYVAGAFLSLIDENLKIFGKPYSRFVKITQDLRYYYTFQRRSVLVNRIYAGMGYPVGNTTIMPYVEQFFSGGANSVRGFVARSLGPGSYRGDTLTYFDQTGDIKLEYNLEYRYRIGERLFGAVFLDVGNIWLVKEDELRPGSGFNQSTFYTQFAIGTGFGLRFDLDFFVIRFDLGLALRHPGYEKGKRWLFENKEIYQLNGYLAIGYPF
jgi:outer membrane protein assembly factor BamA